MHPDIFLDRQAGKYVLSFTPYAYSDERLENPCVVLSDDGIRFYEERAGLNPLAAAPEKDHNDDPDISFHGGLYSLLYLETVRPDYQNVVVLQSRDRLEWKRSVLYREDLSDGDIILSPAVLWEGEECRCFFVLGNYGRGHQLRSCSAGSLGELDFSGAEPVALGGLPAGLMPWHVDVFSDGGDGYLMLLCAVAPHSDGKGGSYSLHLARIGEERGMQILNA